MRLQVSFYLLNKLCFPVIRMVFPAFEAFQGRLTKNLQELNNPEVQTPRPKQRAGTESRAGRRGGRGGGGGWWRGHPRVGSLGSSRKCAGAALPAPPERCGFAGTGTTLRPLFGALLLEPPPLCEDLAPSHTRTRGSVTQPHGTTAAPGAVPTLHVPAPRGFPPLPRARGCEPGAAGGAGGVPERPPGASSRRGDPAGAAPPAPHWSARADGRARGSRIGWRGGRAWCRHQARRGSPGRGDTAGGGRGASVPSRERPCGAAVP